MKNNVDLIGYVAKSELRKTQTGKEILVFSVATSKKWKDKTTGEVKEETQFHNCELWNPHQFLTTNVVKGALVNVFGEITYQKVEKQIGGESLTLNYTKIRTENVLILKYATDKNGVSTGQVVESDLVPEHDDDLPF